MSKDQSENSNTASDLETQIRPEGFKTRISEWNVKHPVLAIVLVSLLAVIINCYPIIFCGKSFVSPVSGNPLVYSWWPPLPGMSPTISRVNQHGSDTAAMMWWGLPVGFIESRSVLEHGELPLWDRYGHAGATLIGQAISMLGDPLQLIVIFGHGSAGAWDIKFLAAKFIFCIGFGMLILRLLNSRLLSLLFAVLAAYCGAYFYINNHFAFFVLAYAPWILLAAIKWLDLKSKRYFRWGLIWLCANFSCFNAGHVETAVVLIGGLNLVAVVYTLIGCCDMNSTAKVVFRISMGTLLFSALTAPAWIPFLSSLDGSYSAHMDIQVNQLSPTLLAGVFDDVFYHSILSFNSFSPAPGTCLLVLAGCCLSILRWRQLKTESFFWVNTGAIVLWSGCIFGWVPAPLVAAIPLLNRVGHTFTDFSYLLVIHLTIQSAFGFKCLAKMENLRQATVDFVCVCGVFLGILVLYFFGETHNPLPWNYIVCAAAGAIGAPMLFVYLKSKGRQTMLFGWAGIIVLGFIPNFRFGLYSDNSGNDQLLMFPGSRTTLNAPSEAINKIKMDKSGPFRVVGLQSNLIGDYSAVYELEDIRSCAPLSNKEFVNLVKNFPGILITHVWIIEVADPTAAQPLLNMLNVKYLLTSPKTEGLSGFHVANQSDFMVLQNPLVWPRAFFSDKVIAISSSEEFAKHLSENSKQPFIALTQEEIKKQPDIQKLEATNQTTIMFAATNYLLSVNSTEFDIHAPSAGMVCLTEGQAKGFTATANNQSKPILTVNRAFRGIYLDKPGDYHIKFTYRPAHWRLSCTLFWLAMGAVILSAMIAIRGTIRLCAADSIAQQK